MGSDNQNGPKRRVWGVIWALGHPLGACFILTCFFITNYFTYYSVNTDSRHVSSPKTTSIP